MIESRAATPDDLAMIMELERATLAEWSEQSWVGELTAEDRDVFVAVESGDAAPVPARIAAGGSEAGGGAPDGRAPGILVGVITVQTVAQVADLHRLLVAPGRRRRGVGAGLVRRGVAAARAHGAAAMMLEVAWDNDPAIALYARQGFEQLGVRRDYYGPGRDALIMKRYDLSESATAGEEPR